MKRVLILGEGYTGKVLKHQLSEKIAPSQIYSTNRNSSELAFDIQDKSTWKELPSDISHTFITFPLTNAELTKEFLESSSLGKIILIGTTSSFSLSYKNEVINENHPIDPSNERTSSENTVLNSGGCVVHAAGIYGPGRNPVNWVISGRVGPSAKYVNWIHVEDLAGSLIACAESQLKGERLIASDNQALQWSEICEKFAEKLNFEIKNLNYQSKRQSKQISHSSFEKINYKLKHPKFIEEAIKLYKQETT